MESKKEDLPTTEISEKERTMALSIKEGSAASVMSGLGDSYISPFALALKANEAHIGLLSSLPGLISPISQIAGSKLMEKYSRRRLIITFVSLQAFMWLPILFISFFMWKSLYVEFLPLILIVFYTLYAAFGSFAGPAWFSLLGDIVPEKIRGKYFSKRNRICGSVSLGAMLVGAFALDMFKTKGMLLLGFSIFFLLASIFRFISAFLFRKHYEPKLQLEKGYYFSFFQFIKKAPTNNFGKFAIYIALINFTTMIAGPFFTVYMLKDLGFSYTTLMLVNISATVFTLIFLPLWGRFSDKYGNRELLKIGSLFVPLLPIFWLFSSNPVYLILVPQLVSGIGWASFNFAASNFIYDCVTPQRRPICVAYYHLMSGIGIFLGAMLGGLIAAYAPISFMNKFLFIFLISGIARMLVVLFMLPKIKEVRKVDDFNPTLVFRNMNHTRGIFEGLGMIWKRI